MARVLDQFFSNELDALRQKHLLEQLQCALDVLEKVGKRLGIIEINTKPETGCTR